MAALRALAEAYAQGADRNDADMFLSAFHPDARLIVFTNADDEEPRSIRDGHDALRGIPGQVARYDKTFHFVGNHACTFDDDAGTAAGEVYCIAHHLTVDDHGATDFVMFIRYHDEYRRGPDGQWRISQRTVRPDWTESRRT